MTLCTFCRNPMKIKDVCVDFGEGDEVVTFETCLKCRAMHIECSGWTLGMG